jgi:hypothetical protein
LPPDIAAKHVVHPSVRHLCEWKANAKLNPKNARLLREPPLRLHKVDRLLEPAVQHCDPDRRCERPHFQPRVAPLLGDVEQLLPRFLRALTIAAAQPHARHPQQSRGQWIGP